MEIVAIIQARMDSTRLPGKVLADIVGKPLLYHIYQRLKRSTLISKIVIATSSEESDIPIVKFCENNKIFYFTGSKDNVLDRYFQTAKHFDAEIVVRITGDSPLIDPSVVDKTIQYYLDNRDMYDYVCNTQPPTFPDGLDTEVFNFTTLCKVWQRATTTYQKEHVTPLIMEDDSFRNGNFFNHIDQSHLRWCVDQEEDLVFVKKIYGFLYDEGNIFTSEEIIKILETQQELISINNKIGRNEGFLKSLNQEGVNPSKFQGYFKKGIIEDNNIYLRKYKQ